MKRFAAIILALALLLGLAAPALAKNHWYDGENPWYVDTDKLKVYEEQDTDSKVIQKLKGGAAVIVESVSGNNKWYGILVEDTKRGGQKLGWVQSKYLSQTMPPNYCKHDWGKWKVVKEATCTKKGERTRTCKICGKVAEESIKKLDHEFGRWKITKEATCAKKGARVRTCEVCGYKDRQEYLDEHTFGAWTLTKEPTCTEKGERVHTCAVCGTTEKQTMNMLPHDYEWQVTLEATDHSSGIRAKICAVCGANGGEETFDPEGTIRRKDRGEDVRALQQLLVDQGYLNAGGADGIFGGGTEKAVIQFQKDQGLEPDGVAWPQTRQRLNHEFGPWTTVKAMPRTEAGERVRVCVDCGFEQREISESGTVFERGRRGEDIRALQQIVKQLGYDAGSLDGIYGRKLDAAFAGFAADHGLVAEDGRIRPADVDALMNAWLDTIPDEDWKGEGDAESPVNLALTVTPEGEPDADGLVTYNWSVTNLGTQKATFAALLLTFGYAPNFRTNNLVMALDGYELKANAGNSASGTFTADMNWGQGSLSFAALAVHEKTGAKWLSNAVAFQNESYASVKTVEPMADEIDVDRLPDGVYPVSFDRGDVFSGASGIYMNAVHVYTEDVYDILDVSTLKEGDTIVVEGEPVLVESVEHGDTVLINGGLDKGGVELVGREDTNGFFFRGYDDISAYTERGVTTLVVDPVATYTDSSVVEAVPVIESGSGIVEAMQASENDYFGPYNTTVRIENGKVVEIVRAYMP